MAKIIYNYHPDTKEYLGESEARESPLEKGVYLIPAYAVDFAPNLEEEKISYFENGQWINKSIPESEAPKEPTLEELKQTKISELKIKRYEALNKSIYSISVNNEGCDFYLRTSDLAAIQARINNLPNNTETMSWGCTDGRRVQLNKIAFESLQSRINQNDETVYNLYAEKLDEIENITSDGEYFDENNNPITPLQALNNININFS